MARFPSSEATWTLLKRIWSTALKVGTILSSGSFRAPANANPEEHDIGPEDLVRVRPEEEIRSFLDEEGKYRGCKFMRGMYEHCGKTYRVLKNVDFFYDETRQKMVRTRNLVILEGVICRGRRKLFVSGCDRNCYFFWHKTWLQKL
jgi:hypothetical protein